MSETTPTYNTQSELVSPRSRLGVLLFCFFLGVVGAHRFYVGKIGTGFLTIVTIGGCFGVWPLVDFILLTVGSFRDKEGRRVVNWLETGAA